MIITPNPCIEARHSKKYAVLQFANLLQVSRQFVENAEHGCYARIPPAYHPYLLIPLDEAHKQYVTFQTETRRDNFSPEDFPDHPQSIAQIIQHLKIPPTRFARMLCVQQAHIHRLLTSKRTVVPQPVIQALLDVGLTPDYLLQLATSHTVVFTSKNQVN